MIEIEVACVGDDRRGLLWDAVASYEGRQFVVRECYQPERDGLRAAIDGTPGFTDCAWRLVRNGRIGISGPSARWMAARTVTEGPDGIKLRLDKHDLAAIYAPPPRSGT